MYFIFCLRKQEAFDILERLSAPKVGPETGFRCGYFILAAILRSRAEGVERVEQSSRRAIRGYMIKVALRAVGAEIYQTLPRRLQNTIQNCPLGSAGSCLALVEGCLWARCFHGRLGSW